ncbi:MAG: hypothetical protein V7695_15380 [Sulfitobacter sp.]|jgi:hypothetical protein
MIRVLSIAVLGLMAAPAFAETAREKDCAYQGDVVAAVQAARVARVKERKVAAHIVDAAPEWPEKYNAVVPLVTPWVYGMKVSELKETDLAAAWKELCLSQ